MTVSLWFQNSLEKKLLEDKKEQKETLGKKITELPKEEKYLKSDDKDHFKELKNEISELRNSLENYIEMKFEDEKDDLIDDILKPLFENQEKEDNDIYRLKKLMREEALGKIKKAASIKYL